MRARGAILLYSTVCLFLLFVVLVLPVFGEVYKYKDSEGNVHYVDAPEKIPEQYRSQAKEPAELPNITRERDPQGVRRQRQEAIPKTEADKAFDRFMAEVTIPAVEEAPEERNRVGTIEQEALNPEHGSRAMAPEEHERTMEVMQGMERMVRLIMGPLLLVMIAVTLLVVVSYWVLFSKAGLPGWGILIPIYNCILMTRIGGYSGWWFLWVLVPIVGAPMWALTVNYGTAKQFGWGTGLSILCAIFPFICIPILAFTAESVD